jgi:hypothetical protein
MVAAGDSPETAGRVQGQGLGGEGAGGGAEGHTAHRPTANTGATPTANTGATPTANTGATPTANTGARPYAPRKRLKPLEVSGGGSGWARRWAHGRVRTALSKAACKVPAKRCASPIATPFPMCCACNAPFPIHP